VGVVKRLVLQGLWRRLVGVGIIGTGLSGSGLYASIMPLAALAGPILQRGLRIASLKRCAGSWVVRP
jgi:hypothetical protein